MKTRLEINRHLFYVQLFEGRLPSTFLIFAFSLENYDKHKQGPVHCVR